MPITISRFTLKYDGLYTIIFIHKNKTYKRRLAIDPFEIMDLIKNENLNIDRLRNKYPGIGNSFTFGITFSKSLLIFNDDAILLDTSFKLWPVSIEKQAFSFAGKIADFLDNAE